MDRDGDGRRALDVERTMTIALLATKARTEEKAGDLEAAMVSWMMVFRMTPKGDRFHAEAIAGAGRVRDAALAQAQKRASKIRAR